MRSLLAIGLLAVSGALASPAAAHRLAPSLLSLEQQPDGAFAVRFKTPRQRASRVEVEPRLPVRCQALDEAQVVADETSVTLAWTVDCGPEGLIGGRIRVTGLDESSTNALVRVSLTDGRRMQAVLHAGEADFVVPERASAWKVFVDYLWLGCEHIATGFDHLLFVFGLVLLAAGTRPLIATVTAFTLGHSVTLSLASLGFVRFPSALTEWVIALTILLLALELARHPPKPNALLRRRPWAVAAGFGLLHGLGFAGALAEVGLPQQEIPLALFSFNVGIELGQLAFVAIVLALRAIVRPWVDATPGWVRQLPVTGMGALAVYWCLDRATALL